MKHLINLSCLALLLLFAGFTQEVKAQTASADTLLGKWTNEDRTRIIEFVKNGNTYEAIIRQAPDQDLVGKKQITKLVFNNGIYKGELYLPKRGKNLSCTLRITQTGNLELAAKAGFVSRSQVWSRVK